jgi:thymidine phosphorylase
VKVGERIAAGATLCVIHANDSDALAEAQGMLQDAVKIGEHATSAPKLIHDVL